MDGEDIQVGLDLAAFSNAVQLQIAPLDFLAVRVEALGQTL